MRLGSLVSILASLVLAVLAGFLAQAWLEQQQNNIRPVVAAKPAATGKIVVATQPLRFGAELTPAALKEIDWPSTSIPSGAFTTVAELIKANERRVVLSAIEVNEPIMKWKITGPGQRASLSSILDPGKKAVTIRVNDVFGVGGFVLPGDRVDVMLTRNEPGATASKKDTYTDVLLQHVRVLGIDQLADDRSEKPFVVKAVTLEVGIEDAQRLTLAGSVGSLSLALRPAGSTAIKPSNRFTGAALEGEEPMGMTGQVVVTRGVRREDYTVKLVGAAN